MIAHRGYAKKFAKFNQRFGRGNGHLSFMITVIKLTAYYELIRIPIRAVFGIELPVKWGFIGSIAYLFACYIIGWLDEKIGFWKQEVTYGIEELNPPMKKMIDQVEEIHKKITNEDTKK